MRSPKQLTKRRNLIMENHNTQKVLRAINEVIKNMDQPKFSVSKQFGNKFVGLPDIVKVLRPALINAGIVIIKNTEDDTENSRFGVQITLVHVESGQEITYKPVWRYYHQKTAHTQMAAETYAFRQTLCNCFLICVDEDDDGNGCSPEPTNRSNTKQPQATSKGFQQQSNATITPWKQMAAENAKTERSAMKRFFALANHRKVTEKQQKAIIYYFYDVTSREDVTEDQYKKVNEWLNNATRLDIAAVVKKAKERKLAS